MKSTGARILMPPVLPARHLERAGRCTCGESNCAHFYTAPTPTFAYGSGHSNLALEADSGLLVLDLVGHAIVAVEVLDRPDVKALLDAALPLPNGKRTLGLACPACGFLTVLDSSYGSYNICKVCDWEDDGVELAIPECGGGEHRESLIEAQIAALARFPLNVSDTEGVHRSRSWRPLNSEEIASAVTQREMKYWMNSAVVTPHGCYWTK